MPTLTDHASLEVAWLEQRDTEARTARANAQTDSTTARQTLEQAARDRRDAQAKVDATRKLLGNAEVAPDATSGGEQLREELEALRAARSAELAAHLEVERSTAVVEATVQASLASKQALALASERQKAATLTRKTIADWTTALTTAPLVGLVADATTLRDDSITDGPYAKAKAAVEGNLPAKLRELASARLLDALTADAEARAHADAVAVAFDGIHTTHAGVAGALPGLEHALERALAKLGDYVKFAVSRRDRAKALLESVIARGELASGVHDSLLEDESNRSAAADLALAVVGARAVLRTKTHALELFIIQGKAADPDFTLPSSNTQNDERDAAAAALAAAEAAYDTTSRDLVAEWEVDVPGWAWTQLAEFVIATQLLDDLKVAPTSLAVAVTSAEDDLAKQRIDVLEIQKSVALTQASVDAAQLAVAVDLSTVNERQRGALEGLR